MMRNFYLTTLFSVLISITTKAQSSALDEGIHFFSVSNFTSGSFDDINGNGYPNNKGGGFLVPGRWDWFLPSDGSYAYVDGSGLIASFMKDIPSGGFLEGGYGWMFNNKKARSSSKLVKVQYGMGVGFGYRRAAPLQNGKAGALYGALWPEFSSIASIGNNLEVIPRFILHPMINNGYLGMRTELNVQVIYKLAGFLGVSAKYGVENHSYSDKVTTSNGNNLRGKASFNSFLLGITIHN